MMPFRGELAAFLVFLVISIAFQIKEGAYGAELAQNADEPAHYVTGLMVRDYLASGFRQAPRQFAQTYYEHYPKVALGHWPPLFYAVQAAWTLLFTPSRFSVLLLMAVLSALTATVLVRFARAVIPLPEAMAVGCLMLCLPLMRELGGQVMSETLVTLTVLAAILHLGDYLDREEPRQALWFGLCAALAILTKGTALVLGLAPPLAILLGWRWRLVKNRSFWVPATIAILVCVPWYLWAPDARHESVAAYGGLRRTMALVHTPALWIQAIGPFASPFALIGIVRQFARFFLRKPGNGRWIAAGALLLSVGCFQCLVVVAYGIRIVSIAVPVLLMFTVSGILWLASLRPFARLGSARVAVLFLAGVLAGTAVWASGKVPLKPHLGYRELVAMLAVRPEWQQPKVLIVSDSVGEGALIAEVAMSESRPGHIIVRGSKFLASENWMGTQYRILYTTPEEVMSAMSQASIALVILDVFAETHADAEPGEHVEPYRMLRRAIEESPGRWQAIFGGPVHPSRGPGDRSFLVFQLR